MIAAFGGCHRFGGIGLYIRPLAVATNRFNTMVECGQVGHKTLSTLQALGFADHCSAFFQAVEGSCADFAARGVMPV